MIKHVSAKPQIKLGLRDVPWPLLVDLTFNGSIVDQLIKKTRVIKENNKWGRPLQAFGKCSRGRKWDELLNLLMKSARSLSLIVLHFVLVTVVFWVNKMILRISST
jgi:hypothetical protein